jgi:hypothetical protein
VFLSRKAGTCQPFGRTKHSSYPPDYKENVDFDDWFLNPDALLVILGGTRPGDYRGRGSLLRTTTVMLPASKRIRLKLHRFGTLDLRLHTLVHGALRGIGGSRAKWIYFAYAGQACL